MTDLWNWLTEPHFGRLEMVLFGAVFAATVAVIRYAISGSW